MRPLLLEFNGINSFSEPAVIDFNELLDFGIFGIFGDTGSGKSTILDCIGFSLYGDVARSRSGSIADIINYNKEKAYVNFEFEITFEGKRRIFRVEREIKRKNAAQTVRVYERKESSLLAVSDGVRECNTLLKRIIGLEQRDFEKCIALPQGEFAQFVKSVRGDRLRLISRLFDLERYGEGLAKKVNARFAAFRSEADILRTKLEPYAQVTKEGIQEQKTVLSRLQQEREKKQSAIVQLREEEKSLSALLEKKNDEKRLKTRQVELLLQEEKVTALEHELARLERAALVVKAEKDWTDSKRALSFAVQAREQAEQEKAAAEQAEKTASLWNEEETEKEITELTRLHALAQSAAETKKKREELTKKLSRTREEYAKEAELFRDFDYARDREQIEAQLNGLGEEDFLTFLNEHGKAMLLRREYQAFAQELKALTKKHEEIQADAAPLIEKYEALSKGEKKDFAHLRAEYEAQGKARKSLREALLMVEKRNGEFQAHREKLFRLEEEGKKLRQDLESLGEERAEQSPDEIENRLNKKREEKRRKIAQRDRARAETARMSTAYAAACEREKGAKSALERAEESLREALGEVFSNGAEAAALATKYGDAAAAKLRVKKYREERALVDARLQEYATLPEINEAELTKKREALIIEEQAFAEAVKEEAVLKDSLLRAERDLLEKCALEKEFERVRKQEEILERLKKLLEGNKFMEYVAEEYLQTVALNASGRLITLTDGRYFLRYDGGFFVGDNFNGGKLRAVYTLSGGETFLVSLSLALALSSEICARSLRPVEFFFLDEGFGTLDNKLVDTVMDSLEKLKSEHFSIGIISHVEELKHRINRKITVTKATEQHGSQIRTE